MSSLLLIELIQMISFLSLMSIIVDFLLLTAKVISRRDTKYRDN